MTHNHEWKALDGIRRAFAARPFKEWTRAHPMSYPTISRCSHGEEARARGDEDAPPPCNALKLVEWVPLGVGETIILEVP